MLVQTIFLLLAIVAQVAAPMPLVEQTVECISIAHLEDGISIVFFWDFVQDDWTCLDHRWLSPVMVLAFGDGGWILAWPDENENCFRVIRTRCYVESWERSNHLVEVNARPWFRQLLNPGLRMPPRGPK